MKINYVLHKNPITPDPDDCRAVVVNTQIYSIADIIKQITGEGSILKETECMAVTEAFLKKIGSNLAEGIGFQSNYFSVGIDMQGVFINENDRYDSNRHSVYANLSAGKPWKENLAKATFEKVTTDENKPKLNNIFDIKSKTNNQTLTPGSMAELQGNLLKTDESVDDEGLYFISENGGGEIKVAYIYQNFPKTIQFEIPETLSAGSYRLEVRNRAHNGKSVRKGLLEQSLTVV
ncbi:MAG: DUF4469 domain-containing protein [Bacteroidales bacterium]|nr:DUF4469 domain-containing protein [Bacteroidales bacterium]MBN2758075.1 DUF4469 domain-containing protein [Bacteroidales bacterium]